MRLRTLAVTVLLSAYAPAAIAQDQSSIKIRDKFTPSEQSGPLDINQQTKTGQKFLQGAIFKRGSVEKIKTIDAEGVRSTAEFFKKYSRQAAFQGSLFDSVFNYTIDRYHFLGEPLIARLSPDTESETDTEENQKTADATSYEYYLMIFHFNVPAVKYALIPTKYGFARFTAQIQLFSPNDAEPVKDTIPVRRVVDKFVQSNLKFTDKEVSDAIRARAVWPVHVVAVHPTNEVLQVTRKDETTHTVELKPEFQGGAAGSYQFEKKLTDDFVFDLPKAVGIGTNAGSASWTFYPAKAQPLMLGSKTTMAVLAIPRLNRENVFLRILSSFDYQLCKSKVPLLIGHTVYDLKEISLSKVPPVKDVLALHSIDIPKEIRDTITEAFPGQVDPSPNLSIVRGYKKEFILDQNKGVIYTSESDRWKPVKLPKVKDDEKTQL